MSLGIWISVIVFCSLALLWGIAGMVFALVNTLIKPIETITGPLGLYVWSSIAGGLHHRHGVEWYTNRVDLRILHY